MATGNSVRVRRVFAPLNTAAQLVCITGGSPTTQVYNTALGQYEPNRGITPCVIHPDVTAYASDGTWKYPQANTKLANMTWKVNGTEISKVWTEGTDYSVGTTGSERGDLKIMRNTGVSEKFALQFSAEIVDERTNVNIPVTTDEVTLNTVAKSDDAYSLALGDDETIKYNPVLDKLLLYDYKVAHGIIAAATATRNACLDERAYLRTIPFTVYKGASKVTSGYTVKLYRMSGTSQVEISTGTTEACSIGTTSVQLDLRLVESASYVVKAFVSGKEVASKQFSVARIYPKYTVSAGQNTDIAPSQDNRMQEALVSSEGRVVECPASVYLLKWSTKATDGGLTTTKQWQEGDQAVFNISDTGLGESSDEELEIAVDAEYKEAMEFLSDGSDALVDENGEYLIGN